MTLAEAEVHILTILKQIMEEKLTSVNIQVSCVCIRTGVCVLEQCWEELLLVAVLLQVASVRCEGTQEEKRFTVYSKERLEEIIAQIKK